MLIQKQIMQPSRNGSKKESQAHGHYCQSQTQEAAPLPVVPTTQNPRVNLERSDPSSPSVIRKPRVQHLSPESSQALNNIPPMGQQQQPYNPPDPTTPPATQTYPTPPLPTTQPLPTSLPLQTTAPTLPHPNPPMPPLLPSQQPPTLPQPTQPGQEDTQPSSGDELGLPGFRKYSSSTPFSAPGGSGEARPPRRAILATSQVAAPRPAREPPATLGAADWQSEAGAMASGTIASTGVRRGKMPYQRSMEDLDSGVVTSQGYDAAQHAAPHAPGNETATAGGESDSQPAVQPESKQLLERVASEAQGMDLSGVPDGVRSTLAWITGVIRQQVDQMQQHTVSGTSQSAQPGPANLQSGAELAEQLVAIVQGLHQLQEHAPQPGGVASGSAVHAAKESRHASTHRDDMEVDFQAADVLEGGAARRDGAAVAVNKVPRWRGGGPRSQRNRPGSSSASHVKACSSENLEQSEAAAAGGAGSGNSAMDGRGTKQMSSGEEAGPSQAPWVGSRAGRAEAGGELAGVTAAANAAAGVAVLGSTTSQRQWGQDTESQAQQINYLQSVIGSLGDYKNSYIQHRDSFMRTAYDMVQKLVELKEGGDPQAAEWSERIMPSFKKAISLIQRYQQPPDQEDPDPNQEQQ